MDPKLSRNGSNDWKGVESEYISESSKDSLESEAEG